MFFFFFLAAFGFYFRAWWGRWMDRGGIPWKWRGHKEQQQGARGMEDRVGGRLFEIP
jgi:hypothetical protein